jgi:L-asparaginase / beta-aspartyl-peptidase
MIKQRTIAILAHGGAGARAVSRCQLRELSAAVDLGFSILKKGGSSLQAVELSIRKLEDSGQFNAGHGSRFQLDGTCRMDASIMEGLRLKAGAVALIENTKNPIVLARLIMEKTPHVLMAGKGAARLGRFFKIQKALSQEKTALRRWKQTLRKKTKAVRLYSSIYGGETVGAVAIDRSGNLAAGASTGGIAFMLPGRIGDSPLIGSGIYADNEAGAVSLTGIGEDIIRAGMAKEICCHLKMGQSPREATENALKRILRRIHGEAGAIVLDQKGEFVIQHTTPFMCAGYRTSKQEIVTAARFRRIRQTEGTQRPLDPQQSRGR